MWYDMWLSLRFQDCVYLLWSLTLTWSTYFSYEALSLYCTLEINIIPSLNFLWLPVSYILVIMSYRVYDMITSWPSTFSCKSLYVLRALILYRRRRFINHLLTYLLTYFWVQHYHQPSLKRAPFVTFIQRIFVCVNLMRSGDFDLWHFDRKTLGYLEFRLRTTHVPNLNLLRHFLHDLYMIYKARDMAAWPAICGSRT